MEVVGLKDLVLGGWRRNEEGEREGEGGGWGLLEARTHDERMDDMI